MFGPSGVRTMALLCYAAKFDRFLSLDCAPTPSTLAQSKERKGSNFAIWQPWYQCFVKNGVGQNETTVSVIVNGGSEQEEEGGDVLTDFYPDSVAAGPDFQDLKAAPPSRPNVTQVG